MTDPVGHVEYVPKGAVAPEEDKPFVIDPGQNIRIEVEFEGEPEAVRFSYMAPGETVAVHDRLGTDGSKIKHPSINTYRRKIDSRGMKSGQGWWYFAGDDDANDGDRQSAKLGKFIIRDAPAALVSPDPPAVTAPVRTAGATRGAARAVRGIDLLGAEMRTAPVPGWFVGIVSGVAGFATAVVVSLTAQGIAKRVR
jgi:hypothetical protein